MAPWGSNSDVCPAPAEKAMSFFSKSLLYVRKGADEDIKTIRAHAKSFKDFASSVDKELENFRKASLKTGSSLYPPLKMSGFEDLEFFKKLKPPFPRSHSNPDFGNQQAQLVERQGGSSRPDRSLFKRAFIPLANDEDFYLEATSDAEVVKSQRAAESLAGRRVILGSKSKGSRHFEATAATSKCKRAFTPLANDEYLEATSDAVAVKSQRADENLAGGRMIVGSKSKEEGSKETLPSADGWEPLRSFKEGLRESATSKFIDNLKNFSQNLRLPLKTCENERDVAPLDVSKLFANLVDQLGGKNDVAEKVCDSLQKLIWKDKVPLYPAASKDVGVAAKDTGNGADELESKSAIVIQSTGYHHKGGIWGEHVSKDAENGIRNIAIVTTASLPWMTGTAVNPLFRAAYLAKNGKQTVTLLVPWLCKNDQVFVYPNNLVFESPKEQENYVRNWLEARVGFTPDFKMIFYPGKFSQERRSIFAAGDISRLIPDKEADIAVLEEPEHLNWLHHGKRWTDKFQHVVGVVHTNYLEYIKREKNGALQAFLMEHVNNWVTRISCEKIVRLSAATQELPKATICNVHGVSLNFLEIGKNVAVDESGKSKFSKGAYFLGKMIWGKGYRELISLLDKHKLELPNLYVDVYGNGEDSAEVKSAVEKLGLHIKFHQGRDHADVSLHSYKVFINPSVSDVVCTTTAEALAMGKIVVCADHPSNEFFKSFPNCLTYKSSEEFVEKVNQAMAATPKPLSMDERFQLSWEAATDRFIKSAELDQPARKENKAVDILWNDSMSVSMSAQRFSKLLDDVLAFTHFCVTGNEALRLSVGALPGTMNYDLQHSKDLHLPPPAVENLVYGW